MYNKFITLTGTKQNKLPDVELVKNWCVKYSEYHVVAEHGKIGDNRHYHIWITAETTNQTLKRKVFKDLYDMSTREIKNWPFLVKVVDRKGDMNTLGYASKEDDHEIIITTLTPAELEEINKNYKTKNKYTYARVTEIPKILVECLNGYNIKSIDDPLRYAFHLAMKKNYCTLNWKKHNEWIKFEFYRLLSIDQGEEPNKLLDQMFNWIFDEDCARAVSASKSLAHLDAERTAADIMGDSPRIGDELIPWSSIEQENHAKFLKGGYRYMDADDYR